MEAHTEKSRFVQADDVINSIMQKADGDVEMNIQEIMKLVNRLQDKTKGDVCMMQNYRREDKKTPIYLQSFDSVADYTSKAPDHVLN